MPVSSSALSSEDLDKLEKDLEEFEDEEDGAIELPSEETKTEESENNNQE